MGVSVASIKTTSKTWPLAATALRPGNRKVLLRASVFSHHLMLRYAALSLMPIARRNRKLEHHRDRVPMNAKALRRLPAAQPVHHHRASYPGIEFHCEHPFGLSMPFKDIETA